MSPPESGRLRWCFMFAPFPSPFSFPFPFPFPFPFALFPFPSCVVGPTVRHQTVCTE